MAVSHSGQCLSRRPGARFDDLRQTVNQQKAKAFFESLEGKLPPLSCVHIKASKLLSDFLLPG